jgi:pyruvate dehydrogenase E2 component (dihydrolipoamide acetyltransferase)
MLKPLTMPQIALGGEEVTIQEWLISAGEEFEVGQPLLEIETDKASFEVEAPFAGVLLAARCAPGDSVEAGAVIGYAAAPGDDLDAARAELAAQEAGQPSTATQAARPEAGRAEPADAQSNGGPRDRAGTALRAPTAFVVVEHGELAGVPDRVAAEPSGPQPSPDVTGPQRLAPAASRLDSRDAAGPAEVMTLSRRRIAIARRMEVATAIPCFSVTRDIPWGPARESVAAARAAGSGVTLTDALLLATAAAAHAHPTTNAWCDGDEVLQYEHVNIGLAVDVEGGVTAPVLSAVETLSLTDIAQRRADLVDRARSGALDARELMGATITLSNAAGLGAHSITPVLTSPQVAAVGVGSARSLPDGDVVTVTFVGDHRVIDGADGARYLASFAEALTNRSTFD